MPSRGLKAAPTGGADRLKKVMEEIIMSITTELLKGLNVTDEAAAKIFAEHGKDIKIAQDKAAALQTQLDEANKRIAEMGETIKGASGKDQTISALNEKIKAFEAAEEARKAAAAEAEKIKGIKARFDPLRGDKQFLNEGTEAWIFGAFKDALNDPANAGKSDAEIYAAIVKDKNIYEVPHRAFTTPKVDRKTGNSQDDYYTAKYGKSPFFGK